MELLLIAGEVSADIHASAVIEELKKRRPDLTFWGIGGDRLKKLGQDQVVHLEKMAFLGIGEVIKHLPFIRRVKEQIIKRVEQNPPQAALLVDYPGFNLRLAKALKKRGVPVIYYISPQLWAWGKRRIKIIQRYVDLMLVLFPFEEKFYRRYQVNAQYVGHPLVDYYHSQALSTEYFRNRQPTGRLGLLPGSRMNEIKALLPRMLQTGAILHKEGKIKELEIVKVNHIPLKVYHHYLRDDHLPVRISERPLQEALLDYDAVITASGTATLECAYFLVPMVIVYHVHPVTYWLARLLVKIDHIGLANIVAEKEIAPELIQQDFTPQKAARLLGDMLDGDKNITYRERMAIVREKLGTVGAAQRAAQTIDQFLTP